MSVPKTDNEPSGYSNWLTEYEELEKELKDLQAQVAADAQKITALKAQYATDLQILAQFEVIAAEDKAKGIPVPYLIQTEIDYLTDPNGPLKDLYAAEAQLPKDQDAVKQFASANALFYDNSNDTAEQLFILMNGSSAPGNQQDQERQLVYQSVENAMNVEQNLVEDAILRINNITNDQEEINKLKEQIIVDTAKLESDIEEAAEYIGFNFDADRDVALDAAQLDSDYEAKSGYESDMSTQQGLLNSDMSKIEAINIQGLDTEIKSFFDQINKAIAPLLAKGLKASEGDIKTAASIMAEVSSFMEMITSKIQQMRTSDQQWIQRITAANSEVAMSQSEVVSEYQAQLEKYSAELKQFSKVITDIGWVLAGVVTLASGGALGVLAFGAMIALTQSGAMDKLTGKVADGVGYAVGAGCAVAGKGNGDPVGATWEKVIADIIVAATIMLIFHSAAGLTAATDEATTELTTAAASAAEEIEMTTIANEQAAESAGAVANNSAAAEEEAVAQEANGVASPSETTNSDWATKFKSFMRQLATRPAQIWGEAADATNNSTWKGNLAMFSALFGTNNGYVDLSEFLFALSQHKANATEKELEKDYAETMMIVKLVTSVIQTFADMLAMSYAMPASGEVSTPSNALLVQGLLALQSLMMFENALAQGGMAGVSYAKGQLTEQLGQANSDLTTTKALGQSVQVFEKQQIALFASKLQQQITELQMMLKKAGEPEMTAGRVLEQTAV